MASFAPYNFTIPDQSPTFHYTPYGDGDRTGGWNVSYTGSNDASFINDAPQSVPLGSSFHRTSFQGASANISWTGTACYLHGDALAGSYTTTIDNGTAVNGAPVSDQHLLSAYSGLDYGDHTLRLDVVQSQEVTIQAAVLTVGIGNGSHTIQNSTINGMSKASLDYNDINPDLQLTGDWDILARNPLKQDIFPILTSPRPGATLSYTFRNTSAFLMYSDCWWDHSTYTVSFRDASDPTVPAVTMQGNGSSRWFSAPCITYFQTGMDRDKAYDITFEDTGHFQSFYYFVAMDASPVEGTDGNGNGVASSSHSPKLLSGGLVAAITIGVLSAVLSLLLAAFLLLRRRQKRQQIRDKTFGGAVVEWQYPFDRDVVASVHKPPYVEPAPAAAAVAAASYAPSSNGFAPLSAYGGSITRPLSSLESRDVKSETRSRVTAVSSSSRPPHYDPS